MPARARAELPPTSWSVNPGYEMRFESLDARIRVELGGEAVADSGDARVLYELGHAPVYYLPPQDVREALITPTEHSSHCPYKGDASYWNVAAGGRVLENAIWAYKNPYEQMQYLAGWMGFYWDRFDWLENGNPVDLRREIDGRINHTNNFAALYPVLAGDWHPQKNHGIQPYEFAADSDVNVWWKNVDNDEWQERIARRVARHRKITG